MPPALHNQPFPGNAPAVAPKPSEAGDIFCFHCGTPCGGVALRRGRVLAIPGLGNRLLTLVVRLTPRWLVRKLVKRGNAPREAA